SAARIPARQRTSRSMSTRESFAEQTVNGFSDPKRTWQRGTKDIIRAPLTADDVARGVRRALAAAGYAPVSEFKLSNSRRMDVAAIGSDGSFVGVEIKVAMADLKADDKWPEYLPWCDFFYFAVPPEFPQGALPIDWGLIVADKFGGEIV